MRRLILSLACMVLSACGSPTTDAAKGLIGSRCGACHRVPGVASATGQVGPSLAHIGSQQIIAGFFANSPELLTQWIEHPQQLLPGNAMPEMGLSHAEALTIIDYLYTMD